MKKKITILTLLTLIALVSTCSHKNTNMTNQSLDKAVKESWIVIITKDLKTDRELVFEGGLKKGDEVLNVTNDFVAIKRKKGDVDIIPIIKDGDSWRVDF